MRLPTVNQFRAQMSSLTSQFDEINKLQIQSTSGKKIQRSSENPLLADKIKAVSDSMQTTRAYDLNNTLAMSRVSLLGTTVQQSVNLVGQIKDLILSAQNDTLNNENRASIAQEMRGYAETLLGLANTRDNDGEYIFSGMNTNVPSYAKEAGVYHYQGGAFATRIALDNNNSVPFNDSGFRVFGDIKTGNGHFTVSSDVVNNTGTGVASPVSQQNISAMIHDNFTLSFVTNGAGQLAYQLTGDSTGQIIPASPLTSPADAPAYVAGANISFNGVSLQITGQPAVGDTFYVKESQSQNIFDTIDAVISVLDKPLSSEKERADFHQVLGEQGTSLSQALNHMLQYFTEVGNRGKTIDDQKLLTGNRIQDQERMLDRLSNAPMEEVLPELTRRLTALELTQQSYLKIQETMHKLFTDMR